MIKDELNYAFYGKDYKWYLTLFKMNLLEYGLDLEMISQYLFVLIKLRKYDEAINILSNVSDNMIANNMGVTAANLFNYVGKPSEAEKILLNKKKLNNAERIILAKSYLAQGKIGATKDTLSKINYNNISNSDQKVIKKINNQIYNNEKYGSCIEISYESFVKKGLELEPGHIIFLKSPATLYEFDNDSYKENNIPYMIWKIENNILYVFPVTTKIQPNSIYYNFRDYDYRNSVGDRRLKDNLYVTTKSNVLTIQDKINNVDFNKSIHNLFNIIFFQQNKFDNPKKTRFLKKYIGEVNELDIIKYIDKETQERQYYLVLKILEDHYKLIRIDKEKYEVIGHSYEYRNKNDLIHEITRLSDNDKEYLLNQIPNDLVDEKVLTKKKSIK